MRVRNHRRLFTQHLESLPGMDPRCTNHDLIDALFQRAEISTPGLMSLVCGRGSCVTTTMIEWSRYIDKRVMYVTRNPARLSFMGPRCTWRSFPWSTDFKPEVVLIDDPLSIEELRSRSVVNEFMHWIDRLEYPTFFANQHVAKGGVCLEPSAAKKATVSQTYQVRDVGSTSVELKVRLQLKDLIRLKNELGRVFFLSSIYWSEEDQEAAVTFEPGNGVVNVSGLSDGQT